MDTGLAQRIQGAHAFIAEMQEIYTGGSEAVAQLISLAELEGNSDFIKRLFILLAIDKDLWAILEQTQWVLEKVDLERVVSFFKGREGRATSLDIEKEASLGLADRVRSTAVVRALFFLDLIKNPGFPGPYELVES